MGNIFRARLTGQLIQWLLLITIVLFIATGFGISQFGIIEPVSLGVLIRRWSLVIHTNLIIPFIILLGLHIYLHFYRRTHETN
jgi:cytochrome b subunit of formate dehydrogenase